VFDNGRREKLRAAANAWPRNGESREAKSTTCGRMTASYSNRRRPSRSAVSVSQLTDNDILFNLCTGMD